MRGRPARGNIEPGAPVKTVDCRASRVAFRFPGHGNGYKNGYDAVVLPNAFEIADIKKSLWRMG